MAKISATMGDTGMKGMRGTRGMREIKKYFLPHLPLLPHLPYHPHLAETKLRRDAAFCTLCVWSLILLIAGNELTIHGIRIWDHGQI
ncbi:hypothetical protein FACHB389_06050 [Nostoc calcicola FACHB-389]|nr:hypothetical protein FACHB389_06050 [Nostoc calcicola FACHB-389]